MFYERLSALSSRSGA